MRGGEEGREEGEGKRMGRRCEERKDKEEDAVGEQEVGPSSGRKEKGARRRREKNVS